MCAHIFTHLAYSDLALALWVRQGEVAHIWGRRWWWGWGPVQWWLVAQVGQVWLDALRGQNRHGALTCRPGAQNLGGCWYSRRRIHRMSRWGQTQTGPAARCHWWWWVWTGDEAKILNKGAKFYSVVVQALKYGALLRCLIATVSSNQARIISLSTVKKGHIVKPAVGVSLQNEFVKLHLDHLYPQNKHKHGGDLCICAWTCVCLWEGMWF